MFKQIFKMSILYPYYLRYNTLEINYSWDFGIYVFRTIKTAKSSTKILNILKNAINF